MSGRWPRRFRTFWCVVDGRGAGFTKFAARVASGEFDATKEESDEWARGPSGQAAAKDLSPEMRKVLGLDLLN